MKKMIAAALRGARTLAWQDWRLLFEAGCLAIFIEIALRMLSFNDLLARLEVVDSRISTAPASLRPACDRAVDRTYRYLPLARTCLKESLVLLRLLRRRGVSAHLRLGVRKEGARLVAHAWIEHDGAPLERTDESYVPLPNHGEVWVKQPGGWGPGQ